MKITITGSLGTISKPLAQNLINKSHQITVISSNPKREKEIRTLGANAAVGTLEDVEFMTKSFTGADAVYTMIPPNDYFDDELNLIDYYRRIGSHYFEAIKKANVKRVVNLSSFGAHLDKGNGIIRGAYEVEQTLNELDSQVSITNIRPTSLYYNLYTYIEKIKNQGVITANYGGEKIIPWVSPLDIATTVAEELNLDFKGRRVRYVASEELTGNETARIIGQAIGKPDLQWQIISDQKALEELIFIGINPDIAKGLTEMYRGFHNGILVEDYFKNRPTLGRVKLKEFAKEFSTAYQ